MGEEARERPRVPPVEGLATIRAALPTWLVRFDGTDRAYVAYSPGFNCDGVMVTSRYPTKLIKRARALLATTWEPGSGLENGRATEEVSRGASDVGVEQSQSKALPRRPATIDDLVPTAVGHAANVITGGNPYGYQEGQCCDECHSIRVVRNGACLKCLDCGAENGCG